MKALCLHVKERIGIDVDALDLLDAVCKLLLLDTLDLSEAL